MAEFKKLVLAENGESILLSEEGIQLIIDNELFDCSWDTILSMIKIIQKAKANK